MYGAVQDIVTELWNTPMTADQAIDRFEKALKG